MRRSVACVDCTYNVMLCVLLLVAVVFGGGWRALPLLASAAGSGIWGIWFGSQWYMI